MRNILHSKILGKGKPLLILHGLFGMNDNWMTLGRKFAEDFQVHLIDLRNHGRSFHDDEMNYEVMTRDIVNYCRTHHLTEIFVIGHSMGGKVAMFFATNHPNFVRKSIIADIAPKKYDDKHSFIFEALQQIDFEMLKSRKEVENQLSITIENQGVLQFLLKNIYHADSGKLALRFNLPVLEKNYHLLNETLPSTSIYKGKTLFLKGQYSDYITTSDYDSIQKHFPHSEIVEIPHAGHWLHAENPLDFYEQCIRFLKPF